MLGGKKLTPLYFTSMGVGIFYFAVMFVGLVKSNLSSLLLLRCKYVLTLEGLLSR